MKALIVDDMPDCRWLTKAKLLKVYPSAEVRFAANGISGLDYLDEFKPDIIFSDLQMPEMDGDEFIEAIRARGFSGPVVLISGEPHRSRNAALFTKVLSKYNYDLSKDFFEEIGLREE